MVPIPVAAALEAASTPVVASALPACAAARLTLSFDRDGGDFGSLSHAGARLVLRNTGPDARRVPALPRLSFAVADGTALPIRFRPPVGMHPDPVVPPVGIAPGAEVAARLRWASADVDSGGRCLSPATASLSAGPATVGSAFAGTLCGPATGPVLYGQTWLGAEGRRLSRGGRRVCRMWSRRVSTAWTIASTLSRRS